MFKGDSLDLELTGLVRNLSVVVDQKEVSELHLFLGHARKRFILAIEQGAGMELEKRSMKDELEERMMALAQTVKEIRRFAAR